MPCNKCNLPHGSCINAPQIAPPNLCGVMVGRLARDRPCELADVDQYFYGEASNPCRNRRQLMEGYIKFLERVYPRRCCDDDPTITLGMVRDMHSTIVPKRKCCSICREFRGKNNMRESIMLDKHDAPNGDTERIQSPKAQQQQSVKRSKRHSKYKGCKIVSRVIDRALQPTWGVLAGEAGKNAFRRVSHELSRDKTVRNCGPGYILWRAMKAVSDDMWDKPFELTEKATAYYPTK